MAPTSTTFKQDLPPPGGYAKIIYERIPAKKLFGPFTLFFAYAFLQTAAIWNHQFGKRRRRLAKIELNDAKLALQPMLLAERDRMFLKHMRANQIEEHDLMKGVSGWDIGTLYGEPIYKTIPSNEWVNPIAEEYYAHANPKYYYHDIFFHWYH